MNVTKPEKVGISKRGIIIYSVITVIFAGIYSFFLYLTNKNMEEGMLKLTKIDPRLIGETIKTIDFFNRNALSLYIELTDKENNNNNKKKSKTKKEKEKKKEKENNIYELLFFFLKFYC